MSLFKGRHFEKLIIQQCLRWYCKYALSYRNLEEMMLERGIKVDHTTIYRWVITYSKHLQKKSNWYRRSIGFSWRVDEK